MAAPSQRAGQATAHTGYALATMMKKHLYILIIFGFSISVGAQNKQLDFEKKILEHFQKQSWDDVVITRDSLYTNSYSENKFNVSISDNLIKLNTTHIVIKNPYFAEKYEDEEDDKGYVKNFPISFSVI